MKKLNAIAMALTGIITVCVSCNGTSKKESGISLDIKNINDKIEILSNNDKFSGCILLTDENRDTVYFFCNGYASKDYEIEINFETKFNIMSITKPLTSVAIARLIEEGKINPSDYISEYLDLKNNIFEKITVEQLLTHTSGLGDFYPSVNSFEELDTAYIVASFNRREDINDYADFIELAALNFEPGEKWKYSNLGYHILGLLIEKAAGMSYYSYVAENIFLPLDMKNSGFWSYTETVKNRATRYSYNEKYKDWRRTVDNYVLLRGTPDMGAYSTVDDLSKFMFALMHNSILSDSFTNKVITPKPELNSPFYGYGFNVSDEKIGHGGDGGGVGAQLTYYKKHGYILVVLSNYTDGAAEVASIFDNMLLKNNNAQ